jgi:hypothetical protein
MGWIYGQLSLHAHAELTFKVSCGNPVRSLEYEYIYFIFMKQSQSKYNNTKSWS